MLVDSIFNHCKYVYSSIVSSSLAIMSLSSSFNVNFITHQLMIQYIFLFFKAIIFNLNFVKISICIIRSQVFASTEYYSFKKIYEYRILFAQENLRIPNSIRNIKINEYRMPNSTIRSQLFANTK